MVAEDLEAIFKVRRQKMARALAKGFVKLYRSRFEKTISVFEAGIENAPSYLSFPGIHHARLRTTNMLLERLLREVKRRKRAVGVFPNEVSAGTLAMEIALRSSEQWALKRYSRWTPLRQSKNRPHDFRDVDSWSSTKRKRATMKMLRSIRRPRHVRDRRADTERREVFYVTQILKETCTRG